MIWLEQMLLGIAKMELCSENLTSRQLRGVALASQLSLRPSGRDSWRVAGSAGKEYCTSLSSCNCPDDYECKHMFAVQLLYWLAAELRNRLCLERCVWRGEMEELREHLAAYAELLEVQCELPPDGGLLYGFSLECIGDDAHYRPIQRVSDLRPLRPWIARIEGFCPQYEFIRNFQDGSKDYRDANKRGSRGIWMYYHLPPGVFEVHEIVGYGKSIRYFIEVQNLAHHKIEKPEVLRWLANAHAAY